VHPVLRAILLHFMIGYDHPFADGNGRTARALFYWSMARSGYWLMEYTSISHILRKAPARYMRAYLHTETDKNDTTTPTPKTSSSSSPPSGCLPRLAGRRCRRWKKLSAPAARWAARPRARWCWWSACAPALEAEPRRCRRRRSANAVDELTRDRSAMSLEAANREVYRLLKEGITVSVPDREHGGQKTERLRVVDWENPENNDFLLVSQFSVTGALYTCRPDLVGFVNGLPLVVIELKKPGVPARAAFDENLTHYKHRRFRRCSGATRC
jgi:hypothetical protein